MTCVGAWTFIPIRGGFTLVDCDEAWRLRLSRRSYGIGTYGEVCWHTRRDGRKIVWLLHREICGVPHGDRREVDHVNGDRLDNRRANLRACTRRQNQQNRQYGYGSSRHRGVYRHVAGGWGARAELQGRTHYLGYFTTEDEAAAAAGNWRREHMPFSAEGDGRC